MGRFHFPVSIPRPKESIREGILVSEGARLFQSIPLQFRMLLQARVSGLSLRYVEYVSQKKYVSWTWHLILTDLIRIGYISSLLADYLENGKDREGKIFFVYNFDYEEHRCIKIFAIFYSIHLRLLFASSKFIIGKLTRSD